MAMIAREANGLWAVPLAGRVLGIDPGLNVTGYAVVEPSPRGLFYIHRAIVEVLEAFPPASVAMERIHSHVRFPRTAILMAHARGAIMLAAAQRQTPVFGYAATRIKKTLTGNGRAPKIQIQHAIMTELGLNELPEPHDVADACAVALCHFHVSRNRLDRFPVGRVPWADVVSRSSS
jgi:crossover junction endodeoxyribonuclease RuvC